MKKILVGKLKPRFVIADFASDRQEKRKAALLEEQNAELRARLAEAEQTLTAIRSGEVDALVVNGPQGEQIFTLQSADEPYRVLIETMSEAALTLSLKGDILYCNTQTAQLLGKPHRDLLGSSLANHVAPADLKQFRKLVASAKSRLSKGEIRLRQSRGKTLVVLVSMTRLGTNGSSALCVVMADLTEIVAAREQLRRAKELLEKRVHQRTRSLSKANAELRQARADLESRVRERTAELAKANKELKEEIEERIRNEGAIRKLERDLAETAEREQSRLGQELHDGLGQELTGIRLSMNVLENELTRSCPSLTPQAQRLGELIRDALIRTKDLAKVFYPVELERNGLAAALKELAHKTETTFSLKCDVLVDTEYSSLRGAQAIQLFRIAQEAVHNAAKHAQPKQIRISLETMSGALALTVEDDGNGLGSGFGTSTGMGLRIMKYRARMIGATLDIGNNAARGVTLNCQIQTSLLNGASHSVSIRSKQQLKENHENKQTVQP